METYKEADFKAAGLDYTFVQDNQSKSKVGVLRGLHFQKTFPQAKLVKCLEGEVFDVAVDLREGSPTYGKWEGVVLSAEKGNMFMIPRGFAHGFVVLSEIATFAYKCDELYHPEDEGGIMWNDLELGIEWPYKGEVYNIGGHNERTNLQVVKTILKELGKSEDLINYVTDRPGHDLRYAMDPTKIETELGWKPEHNFDTGIIATIKWNLENQEWLSHVESGEYMNWLDKNYNKR